MDPRYRSGGSDGGGSDRLDHLFRGGFRTFGLERSSDIAHLGDSLDALRFRFFLRALNLLELFQVGQAFEILEPEYFEEFGGRFIQHRAAGRFLAATDFYQPPLQQGFQHAAAIDAAHLFDLRARNRLAICDDGERLEERAAKARRLAREQLANLRREFLARAKLIAARDFLDGQAAPALRILRAQRDERVADLLFGHAIEHRREPIQ